MFENPEIALDDLPAMDDLDWQPMDRQYLRRVQVDILLVMTAIGVVNTVINLLAGNPASRALLIWVVVILVLIGLLYWTVLSVRRKGYVVRDKDIVFRSGVLWRSVTAVPFNRVQHVETSHSLLDRKFGLAALRLFTAGGSGADLKIPGLSADTAEQLRAYILEKVGSTIESA
jgi:membrane protein YdbS with pleckstrin-like domain